MKRARAKTYVAVVAVVFMCLMVFAGSLEKDAFSAALHSSATQPAATPSSVATAGLAASAVSPPSSGAVPTLSLAPTSAPSATPDPAARYFSDREKVSKSKNRWTYTSPVLGVDIIKISYKKPVCETYFVADIHLRDPGLIRSVFSDKKEKGSPRLHPRSMAKKNDAVLLINGDFFTEEKNLKGIVMRNGKLKYNGKKEDTLAVMPDGALRIYSPNEITPEELQALGVKDTFSFGPTLIRDGAINPNLEKHRLFQKNPRTGVGMIEPGHYIFIAVDGRQPGYSVGFTLRQFAEIFQSYGCVQAYNMDGGQSTAICFMGEQLNIMRHGEVGYPQRLLPDALIIGKSDLVD